MKKWIKRGISLLGITFLVFCNGCILIGNRGDDQQRTKTLGEQLVDLKKAKDAGAISDAEYEAQRAKLLEPRQKR